LLPDFNRILFSFISAEQPVIQEDTCNCVPNAECRDGVCVCLPDYYGDGYVSCRPECILNNDCPNNKACIRNKCKNPCTSVACGEGANCDVIYHAVMCTCPPGTTGSPFIQCKPVQNEPVYTNPCQPSPCGPNSQCREVNHQAVCSCLPNYFGSPPNCRPECTVNSDCPLNKACFNQKCTDPCPGTCGQNANCRVTNHNPHCSCKPGFTGDPVVYCNRIPRKLYIQQNNYTVPSLSFILNGMTCNYHYLPRDIGYRTNVHISLSNTY
jgi:hypothetical protein